MRVSQITEWCHEVIKSQAQAGGFYIDATMGKGNDTLMLCRLAGMQAEYWRSISRKKRFGSRKRDLRSRG